MHPISKFIGWAGIAMVALASGCGGSVGFGGGVGAGGVGVGAGGGGVGVSAGGMGAAIGIDEHRRDVEDWYKGRIKRLTSENGYLTLVALCPLPDGRHTFGSATDNECVFPPSTPTHAGAIVIKDGKARLEAEYAAGLMHGSTRVSSPLDLATDKDGAEPTEITVGTVHFFVIDRPGSLYLRVKDSASPVRAKFDGIDRFKVDRKWRVPAHLTRYDPPKMLVVPNIVGFDEEVECPGVLTFQIGGQEYRLEPISESEEDMWIVFGDATNGHDTYGGGRFVYIPAPDANGNTVIDFNKAYNPPCVFTNFATCPLPTRDNVLAVRVEAGEKMWGEAH